MMFKTIKLTFALLVLVCCQVAFADIVISPPGLNIGDQYRLVFVTSGTRDALSSDIAVYNSFVTAQANQNAVLSALNTTWTVIGSTATVDARDNTGTNFNTSVGVPIYNLQGQLNATSNADLWDGTLVSPIRFNQVGVEDFATVFTGTSTDGVKFDFFGLRYLGSPSASVGGTSSGTIASGWVSQFFLENDQQHSFYAMSSVLTVTAVPEPGSLILVAVCLCTGAWGRLRRKKNS